MITAKKITEDKLNKLSAKLARIGFFTNKEVIYKNRYVTEYHLRITYYDAGASSFTLVKELSADNHDDFIEFRNTALREVIQNANEDTLDKLYQRM